MTNLRAKLQIQTAAWPTLAFVVVSAALLTRVSVNWSTWRQATCMPGACFCELIRSGSVRQVANTWSSLAFVWVGLWVLGVGRASGSLANAMTRRTVYPVTFALALIAVGIGSAFYHASLTFAGQFADVFGMYLIGTFVLIYNMGRLRPMSAAAIVASYVALNVVLACMLYFVPETRRYLFAMVILAALTVEYFVWRRGLLRADARYLIAAISALAVAFIVWTIDLRRIACSPQSVWQGHALWHVLGAVACAGVFLFYRSERSAAIHHT